MSVPVGKASRHGFRLPTDVTFDPPGPDEVHLWTVDPSLFPSCTEEWLEALSPSELERAARFKFEAPRERFTVTRCLLRHLLGAYLRIPAGRVPLSEGPHGKPRVGEQSPGPALGFNVAHTDGCVLIAIASDQDVGVDVEGCRPIPDAPAMARRFFTAGEAAALLDLDGPRRDAAFLTCWVRKEAVAKALGTGLTLSTTLIETGFAPHITPRPLQLAGTTVFVQDIRPADGYVAALASTRAVEKTILMSLLAV